ncbi:hypothetical protein EIP91_010995 [Steccherinum ochraceum]|uniref:Uncharacterized protein n=1 Tax=Steccherinum ochraceum TaxID=92696 RepID=A0A4V2MX14_9APHY|nr:hypothetical protein EIP91_010995 [Steccherinum ochraceum]
MHRIFYVPELVGLFIRHISVRGRPNQSVENTDWNYSTVSETYNSLTSEARQNIKALGQASKVFTEACLNEAWLFQTGLIGLLRLVGAVHVLPTSMINPSRAWKLTRRLTEEDMAVILRHSIRIQELTLWQELRVEDTEGAEDILAFGRAVVLFPKLRALFWHGPRTEELDFVMSTMRDGSLTHMAATTSATIPSNFMAMVEKRRRHLEYLELFASSNSDGDDRIGRTVQSVLSVATGLTALHISEDVSEHLNLWDATALLPRLSKLSLVDSSSTNGGPSDGVTYPSLTFLDLQMENPDALVQAMNSVTLPSIQKFEIKLKARTSTHRPLNVLSAIARSCSESSLKSLSLLVSSSRGALQDVVQLLGPDSLDMFLLFPLRHLRISMSWSWDLTDNTMERIANRWPDIETLDIDPEGVWPTPSNVTAHGLHTLAVSCRRLYILGMQFNSTPPDFSLTEALYSHMGGRAGSTTMGMLNVGRSAINRPAETAMLLSCLCFYLAGCLPDLAMHQDEEQREICDRWIQVSQFLSMMGLARRQERWWEDHNRGDSRPGDQFFQDRSS